MFPYCSPSINLGQVVEDNFHKAECRWSIGPKSGPAFGSVPISSACLADIWGASPARNSVGLIVVRLNT